MTSPSFSAAQERVRARRNHRQAEFEARLHAQGESRASSLLSRLPLPFANLGRRGLETWGVVRGRQGTRPAFRVGQVDAELLDEELLELLRGQVGEALKYFGVRLM